jgi:hypothetical protein
MEFSKIFNLTSNNLTSNNLTSNPVYDVSIFGQRMSIIYLLIGLIGLLFWYLNIRGMTKCIELFTIGYDCDNQVIKSSQSTQSTQ